MRGEREHKEGKRPKGQDTLQEEVKGTGGKRESNEVPRNYLGWRCHGVPWGVPLSIFQIHMNTGRAGFELLVPSSALYGCSSSQNLVTVGGYWLSADADPVTWDGSEICISNYYKGHTVAAGPSPIAQAARVLHSFWSSTLFLSHFASSKPSAKNCKTPRPRSSPVSASVLEKQSAKIITALKPIRFQHLFETWHLPEKMVITKKSQSWWSEA